MTNHTARWKSTPKARSGGYSVGVGSADWSVLAQRAIRVALDSDNHAISDSLLAVLDPIEPGYSVCTPSASPLAAGADEAVADDTTYTDEQAGIVVADSDRIDLDVMEHERQSRLERWQRQPWSR